MKQKHLDKIKELTKISRDKNRFRDLGFLMEEVGELAKDLVEGKLEHAREEAVDVLITAVSCFYSLGGTEDLMDRVLSKQLKKWERNV